MNQKISLFSLCLLIVAAIDSIRTLPTTALFGSSLIFFFILSACFFLFPVAFISAELASRYPNQGGIYHWIKNAFGPKFGALAVWLQWINTLVWYPTMLLFIAGTAAYLINPMLATSKIFLLTFSVGIFWGLTFMNFKGVQVSAKISSFCGLIGTILPMIGLIALGAYWVFQNHPVAISFQMKDLIPQFDLGENGIALVTIMASFVGMELAGVHVTDIENPSKNFPKAIGLSVFILLFTLILGALAIGIVIPNNEIRYVDGVMQTFSMFFHAFHIPFLVPVLALFIILGSIGGSVNWLLSPAKGLMQAAEGGFLPPFFLKKNRHNISTRILTLQAVIVSCFCLLVQLIPTINSFYWFLMALSTALYMFMYILLFLAALKLKRTNEGYQIPKGLRTISCISGLLGSMITIIVGFQPSPDLNLESKIGYVLMVGVGLILSVLPVGFLWAYRQKTSLKQNEPQI